MQSSPKTRAVTAPVIISVILLIVAAVSFFVTLLLFSPSRGSGPADATLEAEYAVITERLLAIGDASRAESLLVTHTCAACHGAGAGTIAPGWESLVAAGERRPPLTAVEYIYESIVNPAAYLVDGYPASMPQDFASRMSEQEIADVLVYLLDSGS